MMQNIDNGKARRLEVATLCRVRDTHVAQGSCLDQIRGVLVGSQAKGSARFILTILATYANSRHLAWPAVATIATLASISERMVQKDLKKLLTLGEIKVFRPGGGRKRPTIYEITLNPCSPIQLVERVNSTKGVLRAFAQNRSKGERANSSSPEAVEHCLAGSADMWTLYSKEEKRVIELYHAKLVRPGNGWLPVTKFSQAVRNGIALMSEEEWADLFDEYANDRDLWPEKGTDKRILTYLAFHRAC